MDQLATEQQKTGEEIQALIRNYNKDSAQRKTSSYFERRLRELSAAWDRFEETDNEIRALDPVPTEHSYFHTDYYNQVANLVKKYQEIFQGELRSIQGTELKDDKDHGVKDHNPKPTKRQSAQPVDNIQSTELKDERDRGVKDHKSSPINRHSAQPVEITTLIRRQKAIMATAQRHLSTISAQMSPQSVSMVHNLVRKLWGQVEDLHYSILEFGDDPTDYDMEAYIRLEDIVRESLMTTEPSQPILMNQVAANTGALSIRLPKVTIPTFDGDYLRWGQFCDMFTQMIHVQSIPEIQKMWYLKNHLTGEAEKLIRHLPLTEANYNSAWNLLQCRYNNKRLLTSAIISKIMSSPAITTDTPTSSIVKNLHDTVHEGLLALSNLGVEVSTWDPLLLHFLVKKLDKQSHTLYEQSITKPKENQSIRAFLEFLEFRFQSLQSIGNRDKPSSARSLTTTTVPDKRNISCVVCKQSAHPLFSCKQFLQMPVKTRLQCIQKNKLCVNCLRPGHKASACTLRSCTKCSQKHNTLLHLDMTQQPAIRRDSIKNNQQDVRLSNSSSLAASYNHDHHRYVILGTAKILVKSHNGLTVTCRALLDSGSQVNLVTERLIKRLGLSSQRADLQIEGIGGAARSSRRRIELEILSRITKFATRLEAFLLPEIVSKQPTRHIDITSWPIPATISLADPTFNQPEHVDILLGAEFHHQLLRSGQIQLDEGLPILQNTVFGWMISGGIYAANTSSVTCGVFTSEEQATNDLIERFWRIDEVTTNQPALSLAEKRCESHFVENTRRFQDGRFMVRLPFLDGSTTLGESKKTAFNRLCGLERRLAKDAALREQYNEFMREYESLGHMSRISASELPDQYYVIPHHYVLKPESTTTKLRVVFDASSKTSSGVSLNDILHNGPTVQPELFTILLRFRLPTYVFTADIQKMYRQILLHPEDRKYQLILWRDDPKQPARYYQLNTVTYGTRSAPYLATKCLQKLAQDNHQRYPLGSIALKEHFYVDDGLVGSNSLVEAIEMQKQLSELLGLAGFNLRKWSANNRRLLDHIPVEDQQVDLDLEGLQANTVKTLGLMWRPSDDQFLIRVNQLAEETITKRIVTSELARIFDPLGLLSPIVVTAKMFIQELWQLNSSWDDPLPSNLEATWKSFRDDIKCLLKLRFPRHAFSQQTPKSIQVHVFVDASQKAYGAAVYLRSIQQDGKVVVRLLCAKSRVAPLKIQPIIRLELCAALLGVQLATRVRQDLNYENRPIFFWSDSEVALAWINTPSSSFETFVANRVARIQEGSLASQWRHVKSADNPADLVSRGVPARKLAAKNIWFYGPWFLHGDEALWPAPFHKNINQITPSGPSELKQKKAEVTVAATSQPVDTIYLIDHRNSFTTLQRIIAYMLRFGRHARQPKLNRTEHLSLTPEELQRALMSIVRTIQANDFKDDLHQLKNHNMVKRGSPLFDLTPLIDEDGIIRVSGRLRNSSSSYDAKHPMLLPYNDPLVKLLMRSIHDQSFHCGPQMLLNQTQQRFWPIKGKTMARSIVHHCVTCAKAKPKLMNQIMGNLPGTRVQPARPFINTGVDFCGPFWVHYKVRGKKPQKAYIVVFCCFATKAVHLELATDLSTDAFIGSLIRFLGRRGHCEKLYCDNATNFVGARNKLAELDSIIYSQPARESIIKACSSRAIQFKFIPPRTPHFGGLWEAAVKSAKHLLLRSVSAASLTYEELETVVVGVEAVLNSRPISPMSTDPRDLEALTPGHFLIGEPLTAQVDTLARPNTSGLLRRWELVKRLRMEFWKRWSHEYPSQLQIKQKWQTRSTNVEPGMMVVIREDNCPIQNWPLGRITKVFKGDDGMVRVVEVKTAHGIRTRSIHRLAPLPVADFFNPEKSTAINPENPENAPGPSNAGGRNPQQNAQTEPGPSHRMYESLSSSDDDSHNQATPQKRQKITVAPGMLTILIALLALPLILASPVHITRLNHAPGMYFEQLATIQPMAAEWNLIIYYDVKLIWRGLTAMYNGRGALQHLCGLTQHNTTCSALVKQFDYIIAELELNEVLLSRKRIKRGAIDLVGNIAHSLFGILDTEYAQEMAKTIDHVKTNEGHLLNLIKNQTTILDATINIIKKDQAQINETFGDIEKQIQEIIHKIQGYDAQESQQRIAQLITMISIQLTLRASSLQRVQALLIDVLVDTHHGRLSPMLLPVGQIKQEIHKIRSHLVPPLQLPIQDDDPTAFYKLMTIKGAATRDYFIFSVKLPLTNQEQFHLFRLTPIPIVINNTIVAIQPRFSLLAVNNHRDHYLPFSSEILGTCIESKTNCLICPRLQTIFTSASSYLACEIDLFNNKSNTPCPLARVVDEYVCVKLQTMNQWIFAFKEPTNLNAVCGTNSFQITLEHAGLLEIQQECSVRNTQLNLHSYDVFNTTTHLAYTAFTDFNISTDASVLRPLRYYDPAPYTTGINDLTSLQRILADQRNTELPNEVKQSIQHPLAISYTTLSMLTVFAVIIFWKKQFQCQKRSQSNNSKPTPAPRRLSNADFTIDV